MRSNTVVNLEWAVEFVRRGVVEMITSMSWLVGLLNGIGQSVASSLIIEY